MRRDFENSGRGNTEGDEFHRPRRDFSYGWEHDEGRRGEHDGEQGQFGNYNRGADVSAEQKKLKEELNQVEYVPSSAPKISKEVQRLKARLEKLDDIIASRKRLANMIEREGGFVPKTPRGWTYLKHGTNLSRWGENNPFTTDEILLNQGLGLAVISEEDFERDQSFGKQYNTTSSYASMPGAASNAVEGEFQMENKPFEMRIYFFQDHTRHTYDPEYKRTLNTEELDDIKKYYYLNHQRGRHPVVPRGEILIKLGEEKGDDMDIVYLVPEKYLDKYLDERKT